MHMFIQMFLDGFLWDCFCLKNCYLYNSTVEVPCCVIPICNTISEPGQANPEGMKEGPLSRGKVTYT
jgi:hypothetical protein